MVRTIVLDGRTIEYTLVRKKVKNVNLRIRPDGSMQISASRAVSQAMIDGFIKANAEKILNTLDRFRLLAADRGRYNVLDDGGAILFLGMEKRLRVALGNKNKMELRGDSVILTVKNTDDDVLKQKTVKAWRREQAEIIITEACKRIYPIFQKRGVPFPELKFREMKSRWGSCQPISAVLTFNTRLIHCPPECIDYVIVHEFSHFLCADHSKEFYKIVEAVIPDWRVRREQLKKYTF